MPEFFIENQGTITYLVYAVGTNDVLDSLSLGMLTNNKIPGLAPAIFTQMNSTMYVKYNVSAKISAKQFFGGQVNKKRLIGVFSGIINALLSAEDYMIDTNTILLDLDYIYSDVSTCETVLICLPVEGVVPKMDISMFFKTIMFSTQFDQTENCDYVARIMNYLNSSPILSLLDFKELLDSLGNEMSSPSQSNQQQSNHQRVAPPQMQQPPVSVTPSAVPPVSPAVIRSSVQQQPVAPHTVTVPPVQQQTVPQPKVTVQPNAAPPVLREEIPLTKDGKEPTLFWLMMHYSKENKALYDAAKASKRNNAALETEQKSIGWASASPQQGFSIPGQENSYAGFGSTVPQSGPPVQPNPPKPEISPVMQQSAAPQPSAPIEPSGVQTNTYAYGQQGGASANFGQTTVLNMNQSNQTTVLSPDMLKPTGIPYLVRVKNNERIPLSKEVFHIGKERSYADYFVSDNTNVSRSHADIIQRGGRCFIIDTNSTNHTFVNGGMIPSGTETILSHGAKIRLADEEFEFYMY